MRSRLLALLIAATVAAACSPAATPRTTNPPASSTASVATSPPTTTMAPTTTDDGNGSGSTVTTTSAAPPTTRPLEETSLALQVVVEGAEQPVFFTEHNGRGYIVDQPGRIWSFSPGGDLAPALDISSRVAFGGERGLLGMAFHPEYPDLLYVNYTRADDGATVVSEFTASGDPPIADPESERVVLVVPQPAGNHNGGMIAFGPRGDLWIGMGDGGGADDQFGNGQRGDTLLGAILRIRVGPGLEPYEVTGNGSFVAPEIWAVGVRNPWRFSFDGDQLWVGDVGQGEIEEIDRVSTEDTGLNFAWPVYEGTRCFNGPCDAEGRIGGDDTVVPIHEYGHDEGCSITGGYVYRGEGIPQLDGHYFFSDWCSGFIRSVAPDGVVYDWTDGTGSVAQVASFGRDEAGEVYVVSAVGTVYRIVEASE
jgi:glucose/arabinose dehydrogenase